MDEHYGLLSSSISNPNSPFIQFILLIPDLNQLLIMIEVDSLNIYFELYDKDFLESTYDINISGIYKIIRESTQNNQTKIRQHNDELIFIFSQNKQLILSKRRTYDFYNELNEKFKYYNEKFEQIKQENEDLKQQNILKNNELEQIKKENEDLKQQNISKNNELEQIKKENENLNNQLSMILSLIKKTNNDLIQRNDYCDNLKKNQNTIENLETEFNNIKNSINTSEINNSEENNEHINNYKNNNQQ